MRISEIRPGQNNKKRFNIYTGDGFLFSCSADTLSRFDIAKGREISEEQIRVIRAADEEQAAREYAFSYASRGPKTEKQFRDKLLARGYSPESVQNAVEMLQEYGYIDDAAYAEAYAAELFETSGRWAVKRKLAERGISSDIIEQVTAAKDPHKALEKQLDRLLKRSRETDPEKIRGRLVRSLAAKGFDFDDIRTAVDRRLASVK